MEKIKNFIGSHKKETYIILGILLVLLVAHSLYKIFNKPVTVKSIPVVRTVTVGASTSDDIYTYPGEVRGKYESSLAFQVGGKIVSRRVNMGDSVKAGQVLMTIDPKDVSQSVALYEAAVNSAAANYKLANDNYKRYAKLYASGAVSAMLRDQYKTQLEAAAGTLQQAQAQLQVSTNQLNYTRLVADHDGVISSLTGEVGMVVAAGTPVATIVQDGAREIQIFVPEGRLSTLTLGQDCTVTFWALDNVTAKGAISEIAPMADAATKTYKVRVALNSMPANAKLGMTAKVSLLGGENINGLLVPRSAIYGTTGASKVWLVKDNKAVLQDVVPSGYRDDQVIITKGLNKGDIVVTAGITKLAEGMEVKLEGGAKK